MSSAIGQWSGLSVPPQPFSLDQRGGYEISPDDMQHMRSDMVHQLDPNQNHGYLAQYAEMSGVTPLSPPSPHAVVSSPDTTSSSGEESFMETMKGVKVTLYHKSRSANRCLSWTTVEDGDNIRVGNSGKLIRAHVECVKPFQLSDVEIRLVLGEGSDPATQMTLNNAVEFVSIKPSMTGNPSNVDCENKYTNECVLHLKLSQTQIPYLQFFVTIRFQNGPPLSRTTARFFTHNNGKKRKLNEPSFVGAEESSSSRPAAVKGNGASNSSSGGGNGGAGNGSTSAEVVQGNLHVYGTVKAQAFRQFSDARLKTDFADLKDALQIVMSLEGKSYRWKADHLPENGGGRVLGLIAQDVQKVVPEVVREEEGFLTVAYTELVPILIEALKQHAHDSSQKQDSLQQELGNLRNLISEMNVKVSSVSTAVAALSSPLSRPVSSVRTDLSSDDEEDDFEDLDDEWEEKQIDSALTQLRKILEKRGRQETNSCAVEGRSYSKLSSNKVESDFDVLERLMTDEQASSAPKRTFDLESQNKLLRKRMPSVHRCLIDYVLPILAVVVFLSIVAVAAMILVQGAYLRPEEGDYQVQENSAEMSASDSDSRM